jgi:voltage-gated potassium channel
LPNKSARERAVERWEQYSTLPLALLALVYLGLYAVEVLGNESAAVLFDLILISDIIWIIFIVDFLVRLVMHDNKKKFLRKNVIELIGLLLPIFRAFRMFRVVIAIGFLTRAAKSLQGRINIYIGLILPILVFTCSLGVYEAEHNAPGANITQYGDAIWWAFVTITTIGYGDYYPVTFEGRAIAVLLMLSGLALVSVITVSFASWFLDRMNIEVTARTKK